MEVLITAVVALAAAGLAWLVARAVVHHRYVKALEGLGWTFVERPAPSVAFGLNNPPFGIGTTREVDDQVVGSTSRGIPFQAFRYESSAIAGRGYVVTMRLPKSLPEFYLMPPTQLRPLIQGSQLSTSPWVAVATDPAFGADVLAAITAPALRMAQRQAVDLSIDHDQLVALHAPRAVADLRNFVDALAEIHSAITWLDLNAAAGDPPPNHLSVYRRPHWVYETQNDDFLDYVATTDGGHSHQARDIIHSHNFGLPFIALHHKWLVTRSSGKHTRTERREEFLLEFRLPFPFFPISVNSGGGHRVRLELHAFNDQYDIRCSNPRFAYDVLHPRQIEYVMATAPLPFRILADGRIEVETDSAGPAVIDFMSDFLRGFFGRVPDFAWQELGAWPRPIPEVTQY